MQHHWLTHSPQVTWNGVFHWNAPSWKGLNKATSMAAHTPVKSHQHSRMTTPALKTALCVNLDPLLLLLLFSAAVCTRWRKKLRRGIRTCKINTLHTHPTCGQAHWSPPGRVTLPDFASDVTQQSKSQVLYTSSSALTKGCLPYWWSQAANSLVYATLLKKNKSITSRAISWSLVHWQPASFIQCYINSVLEDRWTNSSKPPNNLNENYKMFETLFWNTKGFWLPISILCRTRTGHSFIDMHKIHHIFCSADAIDSIPILQPRQLWAESVSCNL